MHKRIRQRGGVAACVGINLALVSCLVTVVGCGKDAQPAKTPSTASSAPAVAAAATDAPAVTSSTNDASASESLVGAAPVAEVTDATLENENDIARTVAAETEKKSTSDAAAKRAAKAPPTASPEQMAKWAIPEYQPMQLVACYDGFGDSLVQTLAASPDGKQFALGGARLTLWSLGEPKPQHDFLSNLKDGDFKLPMHTVAISADGKWLAAGDNSGRLRLWDLSNHGEAISIQAHDSRLMQLAFSPNSQVIATTSYSGDVSFWQVADGKKIKSLKCDDQEISNLVFVSPNLLACTGAEASLWNLTSGKKEAVLAAGRLINSALGSTRDGSTLAYADDASKVWLWSVEKRAALDGAPLLGGASESIAFSTDGKLIAARAADSTICIWDVATRQVVQVIDADGGRTSALTWLPQGQLLLVASQNGRVRIWGTPEATQAAGLTPLELPKVAQPDSENNRPLSSSQLARVIDVRSFPRLLGGNGQWGTANMVSYTAPVSRSDAVLFYRVMLAKAGWQEITTPDQEPQGLTFTKQGCLLNISLYTAPNNEGLQISLNFTGNYDVRRLPKIAAIESKNSYSSPAVVGYVSKAALTDLEVELLKEFHSAGWTAYSRLAASSNEEPESRMISMLQGGSTLNVYIRHPADSKEVFHVQIGVSATNKSLPIPPDSGWIEFDSSTDLQMVANTKMNLDDTVAFYDQAMTADGWLKRDAGRLIKDGKGFLPYIRGQQDVLIRLVTLDDGRTRVIVGEAERSSWQLAKPETVADNNTQPGLEAADYPLPAGAKNVKYDVDQKQIHYTIAGVTPPELAERVAESLKALGWTREKSGVVSDDYTLATFTSGKAELELRARLEAGKDCSAIVSGDELLWTKPLPTAPVRVSYGTWLRRNRLDATLDRLPEFAAEMQQIH